MASPSWSLEELCSSVKSERKSNAWGREEGRGRGRERGRVSRQEKNSHVWKGREYIGREEEGEGWETNTRREDVCPCEVGGEKEKVELKKTMMHELCKPTQSLKPSMEPLGLSPRCSTLETKREKCMQI